MVEINARYFGLLLACLLWATTTSASAAQDSSPLSLNQRDSLAQERSNQIDARDGQGVVIPLRKRARPPVRAGSLSASELAELSSSPTYTPTDLEGLRNLREKIQDKYSDRFADGGQRIRARRQLEQETIDKIEKRKRKEKRTTETLAMTNNNFDVTYSATMMLGTPAKPFEVILDTGSADAWVTSNTCIACTKGNAWDPSTSSSWTLRQKLFSVSYGSGNVAGRTGSDVVTMGGYTISDQVFGLVDQAGAVLPGTTEGIMGLGFGRIAKSGGTPFWLRLAGGDATNSGGTLDSPLFSFWFSRFIDSSSTDPLQPGGQLTIGGTNSSLYSGNINYYPAVQPAEWWVINLDSMTADGTTVSTDASTNQAIIDSGTTLVGGEESILDSIFAQIPDSKKGDNVTIHLRGYYVLPCDATPTISLTFGGTSYTMSAADILYQRIDDILQNYCLSSFFVFSSSVAQSPDYTPAGQPYWLVGDAFLKNVYSVFSLGSGGSGTAGVNGMGNTGGTAQVGFAQLSSTSGEIGLASALASNTTDTNGIVNSPSTGGGSGNGTSPSGSASAGPHTAGSTVPLGIVPTEAGNAGSAAGGGASSTTTVFAAPTNAGSTGAGYASRSAVGSTLLGVVIAGMAGVLAGTHL